MFIICSNTGVKRKEGAGALAPFPPLSSSFRGAKTFFPRQIGKHKIFACE